MKVQSYVFQKKAEIIEQINSLLDLCSVIDTATILYAAVLDSKAEHQLSEELVKQMNHSKGTRA